MDRNKRRNRGDGRLYVAQEALENALSQLRKKGVFVEERSRGGGFVKTGLSGLDHLLGGGLLRGDISEIGGRSGALSLSLAMVAAATRRGERVAWIDGKGALDIRGLEAAGVLLEHFLWVRTGQEGPAERPWVILEEVLGADVFTWAIMDLWTGRELVVPQNKAVRVARSLKRKKTVLVLLGATSFMSALRLHCRRYQKESFEVLVSIKKYRLGMAHRSVNLSLGFPVD